MIKAAFYIMFPVVHGLRCARKAMQHRSSETCANYLHLTPDGSPLSTYQHTYIHSLFNDHVSLPCNIQLRTTHIINFSSQQQRNIFGSGEEKGQWLKPTTVNPGGHSSIIISIHRQHITRLIELIHYFYTRAITNNHIILPAAQPTVTKHWKQQINLVIGHQSS